MLRLRWFVGPTTQANQRDGSGDAIILSNVKEIAGQIISCPIGRASDSQDRTWQRCSRLFPG
jgi:hypothetical protein